MKTGRGYWLFVALGLVSVHCSNTDRDFGPGEAGAGGRDGVVGGSDGAPGGSDGNAGGSVGTAGGGGELGVDGDAPVITTASLPEAKFNASYSVQLVAEGSEPFTFRLS